MAYKKRKRANKYEKKIRVNATFEEAMDALLGVHTSKNKMSKEISKTFTFKKGQSRGIDILRENYSITIPDTLASNLEIIAEQLSPYQTCLFTIYVEKPKFNSETNKLTYNNRSTKHFFEASLYSNGDRQSEALIRFPADQYDFIANTVLADCFQNKSDVTIKITIRIIE